ncbi:MAG: hypothetical protein IPJ34_07210 [Myxococcales bacterium]|nr:hypothetical protein [Myxococcales bacterium]
MPLPVFECCCVVVIVATLAAMARARRAVLGEYAVLAVAGWLGEQSCVAWYRFYAYAPGWHLRLGHVPVLVPLIWPLVILSARDVVRACFPEARWPAALVGLVVVFDASLVEVVAVRAGLWGWAEPGHLGVPILGVLGWGYFAFGASLRPRGLLQLVFGLLVAHALILASWWGLFRWTLRGELGWSGFAPWALLSVVGAIAVVAARRRGHGLGLDVAGPRVLAAGLFVALLLTTAPRDPKLLLHTALVAVPYLLATSFRVRAAPSCTPRTS